ncbi:N-acetylmuramoyl-L-alanine amidase [Paenibacillus sp. J5C_2022]|uniref:N-acetylmuramoyl-L-alanine amidase n=1 Tax=Paenibacillus sp. J5C2022 TaxID=2977129 RepID=UPI0021D287E5|nr:N-acetylmuramoyl-L-alanine amidase [Paenibacillus sp. J5C2022]MCU6709521.1 N-acetylmuramoyl-L-alanine amidase [Paenibacillus sp. J5C2022]
MSLQFISKLLIGLTTAGLLIMNTASANANSVTVSLEEEEKAAAEQQWTLPHPVVLIDVGHGGIDGGTSQGDILEKDINLAIARKLYVLLRSEGIPAVMNRTGDYALSAENRWHHSRSRHFKDLTQRRQLSEEIDSRLFISLHVNWGRNRSARGPVVLHQPTGESALLAFCLQNALNRQQNSNKLPIMGDAFYLLKKVEQPAVIVEMGFISNPVDVNMLTSSAGQLQVAKAIVSGIRQYQWVAQ